MLNRLLTRKNAAVMASLANAWLGSKFKVGVFKGGLYIEKITRVVKTDNGYMVPFYVPYLIKFNENVLDVLRHIKAGSRRSEHWSD
jgi:hypothetical protein